MGEELQTNWAFKMAIKKQGFTLRKLQKATGINRSVLSLIATGRYNVDNKQRRKIAKVIGLSEEEIFGS